MKPGFVWAEAKYIAQGYRLRPGQQVPLSVYARLGVRQTMNQVAARRTHPDLCLRECRFIPGCSLLYLGDYRLRSPLHEHWHDYVSVVLDLLGPNYAGAGGG
jgi:hypothetical protein